jgi:hypothetical protein
MPVTSVLQKKSCLAAAAIHSMWFQHKGTKRPTIAAVSAVHCHIGSHHETTTGMVEAKWALKLLLGMVVMR